ncbi:hypothetical protein V1521DRAFT_461934 [Lipomyces starkeyi]
MAFEINLSDREQEFYQRALNFLKANEPEKRLDVRLSPNSFRLLDEQAHALYGDSKYPRVQYSAVGSRVVINTLPTAQDSGSASGLQDLISKSVRDTLIRLNKWELCDDIFPIGDSEYSVGDNEGRNSINTPAGGLKYINDECNRALTLRDIKLWLNQLECQTAMIIFLTEDPSFRIQHMKVITHARPLSVVFHLGPIIEVVRKNSTEVVINGEMVAYGDSVDIGLTMGDVFPRNHVAVEDIRAEPVLLATPLDTATTRFYKIFKRN